MPFVAYFNNEDDNVLAYVRPDLVRFEKHNKFGDIQSSIIISGAGEGEQLDHKICPKPERGFGYWGIEVSDLYNNLPDALKAFGKKVEIKKHKLIEAIFF